jgi:hypothetical protein
MKLSRIGRGAFTVCVISLMGLLPGFAFADDAEIALQRVRALEREIEAVKKENEALRQLKKLREENAALVRRSKPEPSLVQSPVNSASATLSPGVRESLAAAAPLYSRAITQPEVRGRFSAWVEGGANWSGGDPVNSFYLERQSISGLAFNLLPRFFPLVPEIGWEAAGGFDYRFAGSPWHASGQLRYAQGSTSESAFFSADVLGVNVSSRHQVSHNETHWLTDLALGRDVLGITDNDALQLKFGLRVAELRGSTASLEAVKQASVPPVAADIVNPQETSFLGLGPRLGVEGATQLGHRFEFDYLGDVALLLGKQRHQFVRSFENLVNQPSISTLAFSSQQSATVINADLQIGVSYWMTPQAKIGLSYRADAFLNALLGPDVQSDIYAVDPSLKVQKIDRYTHGPRLAVTGQF